MTTPLWTRERKLAVIRRALPVPIGAPSSPHGKFGGQARSSGQLVVDVRRIALAILLDIVVLSAPMHYRSARGAEIQCAETMTLGKPIPEEVARKRWPSGFRPVAGMCTIGYLHGIVARGDFEKVSDFYKSNHRVLWSVLLWSSGGEVDDAIKIGKLFRKYLISVVAPATVRVDGVALIPWQLRGPGQSDYLCEGPDCVCASACALIWLGGVDRFGEVGLHRPRITDLQFKSLPPAEAAAVYRRTLADIEAYLRDMEVPRPIIDAMVATGSSEIQWVDPE